MGACFVKVRRCQQDRVRDRNPENYPEMHRGRFGFDRCPIICAGLRQSL
jgi:hypothetical protein